MEVFLFIVTGEVVLGRATLPCRPLNWVEAVLGTGRGKSGIDGRSRRSRAGVRNAPILSRCRAGVRHAVGQFTTAEMSERWRADAVRRGERTCWRTGSVRSARRVSVFGNTTARFKESKEILGELEEGTKRKKEG